MCSHGSSIDLDLFPLSTSLKTLEEISGEEEKKYLSKYSLKTHQRQDVAE